MAEKLKTTERAAESLPSAEQLLPTAEQAEPLRKGEKDPAQAVREARAKIEETTKADKRTNPIDELQAAEKASKPAAPLHITRELKDITLNRELTAIRRRLSAPQRTMSKFIHLRPVRAVSEPLSGTATRPSGLLGGGLVAFLGTSAYLYFTRHNGVAYNYFIFIALFIGGFVFGLLLELLVHAATAPQRRHD